MLIAEKLSSRAIEPLHREALEALADFQQRAYADQFNARFFLDRATVLQRLEWQHLSAPGMRSDRLPVWVLRRGSSIAGQLVVTPVQVKLGGRWVRGGWCQDFIVAPEYRGRGTGVTLLRETLRAVASEMDVVLAGGTNHLSYPIFRAAGFQDLGVLPRYAGLTTVARLLAPGVGAGQIVITPCDAVDDQFDRLWGARETAYAALILRDQTWMRWRFVQHPHWAYTIWAARRKGELAGYAVARLGSTVIRHAAIQTCRIVELVGEPSVAAALLTHVVRFSAQHRCRLVRCDLLDSALGSRVLRRRGIWSIPSSNRVLVNVLDPAIGSGLTRLDGWFLSAADSDFDLYEP